MLAVGLAVILIGGLIIHRVINMTEKNEQEKQRQKREEKRSWI